ncbi:MAG: DUF4124 domain-containing protein [Azoarcus sp.]|nr:DUF4124 domain-containing protein [Azoarcus sp.]
MKRPIWFIALMFGLTATLAATASAEIYKWKDKDGKVHFSDTPPPSQPGVKAQQPKRTPPPVMVLEPEPDEDAEEGAAEPKDTATPAPAQSQQTQAEQRDEEFRKRRAAAAEARQKAEKDAAAAEERKQNCQRARAQHATLSSGQRVALPTETGGHKYLNDEERAAEIARAKGLMETFCGKD